ncbi:MAG: hypothetical protein M3P51_00420 [Chloroflexota bacterium]|nr:hypothetical protein [Chloroflexota bacterium]
MGEKIKQRLRVLRAGDEHPALVDDEPCCVYGLVTRATLDNLAKDVEEVKGRVGALLWGVGGAVLLDVLMRLSGR